MNFTLPPTPPPLEEKKAVGHSQQQQQLHCQSLSAAPQSLSPPISSHASLSDRLTSTATALPAYVPTLGTLPSSNASAPTISTSKTVTFQTTIGTSTAVPPPTAPAPVSVKAVAAAAAARFEAGPKDLMPGFEKKIANGNVLNTQSNM
jgi:hypothetical protein